MPSIPRPQVTPRAVTDLLAEFEALAVDPSGSPQAGVEMTGVTLDSRRVQPGDLYAALPGFTTHGANFAAQALDSGAAAILTDEPGARIIAASSEAAGRCDVPLLVADDPRGALGQISDWIYGKPSADLRVIGITGTNGKTTMSHLVADALTTAGREVGLIGTLGTRLGEEYLATVRTTPESPDVHALLALMRERGVDVVVMEVSSHALRLGRVDGVRFVLGVFTNLTQDHLDFHEDMEDYFDAKCALFEPARTQDALICVDDDWGRRLVQLARSRGYDKVQTYSGGVNPGGWGATEVRLGPLGSDFRVVDPSGASESAHVPLAGDFNVTNAVGAIAAVTFDGVPLDQAAAGVGQAKGVPGRMEFVDAGQRFVAIVDYAHTPDAVSHVLAAVRGSVPGRIIAVVGCGGDRDRDKRAPMGAAAAAGSDVVVITDDNPRSEDPAAIRAAMLVGAVEIGGDFVEIGDRAEAIAHAVDQAGDNDAVIVLGKGHEQGQEVAGVVTPFDDRQVLADAIARAVGRASKEERP